MSIFSLSGQVLSSAYSVDASVMQKAYDVGGNEIFSEEPPTLKVMTYNVGQWYNGTGVLVPADKDEAYYALQNGMIKNADADILFICEYHDTFSLAGRTAQSLLSQYYPYVYASGWEVSFGGRSICSKYPLSNATHHSYSSGRYYDTVTITVDNTPITLVVTHLSTNSSRVGEVGELIAYLRTQQRFIAAGDYNTLYCRSENDSDYTSMIVPLLNVGFNLANCSTFGFMDTYFDQTSQGPNVDGGWAGCLDNIVTSSNIDILSAHVDTTKLTDGITDKVDHMPLIATLQIN